MPLQPKEQVHNKEMLRRLRRPEAGTHWDGPVARFTEPELVSFPGFYALQDNRPAFMVVWKQHNPEVPEDGHWEVVH